MGEASDCYLVDVEEELDEGDEGGDREERKKVEAGYLDSDEKSWEVLEANQVDVSRDTEEEPMKKKKKTP